MLLKNKTKPGNICRKKTVKRLESPGNNEFIWSTPTILNRFKNQRLQCVCVCVLQIHKRQKKKRAIIPLSTLL